MFNDKSKLLPSSDMLLDIKLIFNICLLMCQVDVSKYRIQMGKHQCDPCTSTVTDICADITKKLTL